MLGVVEAPVNVVNDAVGAPVTRDKDIVLVRVPNVIVLVLPTSRALPSVILKYVLTK